MRPFLVLTLLAALCAGGHACAAIGQRFPSERKEVVDPVTGTHLTFLTSRPHGDSKIYQTHPQWTADGQWLIFRSRLTGNEAMAVNERTGDIVQVTEGGYEGMLNAARKSMKLYFLRRAGADRQVVEVDLARVLADSAAGRMQPAGAYQRVAATLPASMEAYGDTALDADEDWLYVRVGPHEAARHLAPGTKLEPASGPRHMGAGPAGIARVNVHTGEVRHVVSVPFQVGHIQANLWNPGEIIFCWETGGKSPQRTWTVKADGSGLRPLYPEAPYEWVTHEAVIGRDEVALAIMGHRAIPGAISGTTAAVDGPATDVGGANPGQDDGWGQTGTSGLAIVNLRTRQMQIVGQTPSGSGFWHVHGSSDGRFAVGDDFSRSLYLIDRASHEMMLLTTGHKTTAADHPHPTFSPDGTRIEIQSAMLSPDGRTLNICIVPVPESWLKRTAR
ncbi:MAG: PD40 domain-containing protein [Massilia sp.]|nr:PD40 domain-containing protein [Massilia sp.]